MNIPIDEENEFFLRLIEFNYDSNVEQKLQTLAQNIDWARGWPEKKEAFWNAEAFMWQWKIDTKLRASIAAQLASIQRGRNLDLGCGAYSYLPSVGFDCSAKMLQFNSQCTEKIVGDVEQKLPFSREFDSVTAIFVLNYVHNYAGLVQEIYRVLKNNGVFVMVLGSKINTWYSKKQENHLSPEEWKSILKKQGFRVRYQIKDTLHFFHCQKVY